MTIALVALGGPAPIDPPVQAQSRPFAILLDAPLEAPPPLPDGPVEFLADLPADAIEIAAVGDVNLGERIGDAIAANGADFPWRRVRTVLERADIAVANLEGALSRRGTPQPKEFTFRGEPSSAAGMARAGVDVVSVANNHAMDFGRDAFADTMQAVRGAGIEPVGGGATTDEALQPALLERSGRRIAFIGATRVLPAGWAALPSKAGVASAYEERALVEAVRAARSSADVVVVLVHWGVELSPSPDRHQIRLSRALVDAGASIVLGSHPHVLQPVVRINGAIVAYSLGNFVFSSPASAASRTMILRVGILPDGGLVAASVPVRIVGGIPTPL